MSTQSTVSAHDETPDCATLDPRVQGYIDFFETLTPATLDRIEDLFEPSAKFSDPFNEVTDSRGIRSVFEHMFNTCKNPGFRVTEAIAQGNVAYLQWKFTFDSGTRRQSIVGVSRVTFGDSGRVTQHEDYWDAAGQLYERLPLIGWLLLALRRKLAAPPVRIPGNG